ncbi:MAG: hypothetical protein HY656_04050 [Acidobacteria bacterium]|nr:hypothetical protein [Acidobacteriota bacterium]
MSEVVAVIPRVRVMSELVEPFTVRSRLTQEDYTVRFSHLWSAIATRHSDTLDCKFLVNGRGVVVALAHPGVVEFREGAGRSLSDAEAAQIAAAYLRDCLEADRDTDRTTLAVSAEEVLRLAEKLGLLR